MNPEWRRFIPVDGFYFSVVDGKTMREGEIHFYMKQEDGIGDPTDRWAFGPIPGFPTVNYGIIDA